MRREGRSDPLSSAPLHPRSESCRLAGAGDFARGRPLRAFGAPPSPGLAPVSATPHLSVPESPEWVSIKAHCRPWGAIGALGCLPLRMPSDGA